MKELRLNSKQGMIKSWHGCWFAHNWCVFVLRMLAGWRHSLMLWRQWPWNGVDQRSPEARAIKKEVFVKGSSERRPSSRVSYLLSDVLVLDSNVGGPIRPIVLLVIRWFFYLISNSCLFCERIRETAYLDDRHQGWHHLEK
jgi:hypothetical protein